MALEIYQTIQQKNNFLPIIQYGTINVVSRTVNQKQILSELTQEDIDDGWFLYTDCVEISREFDKGKFLLEAEVKVKDCSYHIKYLSNDIYSIVKYVEKNDDQNYDMLYQDQLIFVRQDLQKKYGFDYVKYRIWLKCSHDKNFEGRWENYVQQFIGFENKVVDND